jgi:hypothetical protein
MTKIQFRLQYELSRHQRIIPNLRLWLPSLPIILLCPVGLVFLPLIAFHWGALLTVLMAFLWTRGFWFGLLDAFLHKTKQEDIMVEENGFGFLVGGQWFMMSLAGFYQIKRFCPDTWTLRHRNGRVFNIPVAAIKEDQLDYIRQAAAKGNLQASARSTRIDKRSL